MSLIRTALIAGVAYYYGKHVARKEAEKVLLDVEEQQTSALEGAAMPPYDDVLQAGREAVYGFPGGWALRDYTLN